MKPLFFRRNGWWFAVLVAGVLLVGAGLAQLGLNFFSDRGSAGVESPATGSRASGNPEEDTRVSQGDGEAQDKGTKSAVGSAGKSGELASKNSDSGGENGETPGREARKNQYYVEYRLERDRSRSQQVDLLREIVNNPNSADETRREAQRRLLAISQAIDTEMKLENLIIAENFKDAVVFVQEKSATIIVQTPTLTGLDKSRLTELAVRVTGMRPENITITSKI